jgi:hypothetical protein
VTHTQSLSLLMILLAHIPNNINPKTSIPNIIQYTVFISVVYQLLLLSLSNLKYIAVKTNTIIINTAQIDKNKIIYQLLKFPIQC